MNETVACMILEMQIRRRRFGHHWAKLNPNWSNQGNFSQEEQMFE